MTVNLKKMSSSKMNVKVFSWISTVCLLAATGKKSLLLMSEHQNKWYEHCVRMIETSSLLTPSSR